MAKAQVFQAGTVYLNLPSNAGCTPGATGEAWQLGLVDVSLSGGGETCNVVSTTIQTGGNWVCDDFPTPLPIPSMLSASRTGGYLNGVVDEILDDQGEPANRGNDITTIREHIVGVSPITNPFRLVAADVNESATISTFDIILIRQVILGLSSNWPAPSYKFIPRYFFANGSAGAAFCNAFNANPFTAVWFGARGYRDQDSFFGQLSYANGDATIFNAPPSGSLDFYGVKMGDVSVLENQNPPNSQEGPGSHHFHSGVVEYRQGHATAPLGLYSVPSLPAPNRQVLQIKADGCGYEIGGVQIGGRLAYGVKGAKILSSSLPGFLRHHYHVTEGADGHLEFKLSWVSPDLAATLPCTAAAAYGLFTLELELDTWTDAKAPLIEFDNSVLANELYTLDAEEHDFVPQAQLLGQGAVAQSGLAIVALPPANDGRVQLVVEGAIEGIATIQLLDLSGRLIHTETQVVTPHRQTLTLLPGRLTAGIYILRLGDGHQVATAKAFVR